MSAELRKIEINIDRYSNYFYCPYDTPEEEVKCEFYEKGEIDNYGCFCRFMELDHCLNRESRMKAKKGENNLE